MCQPHSFQRGPQLLHMCSAQLVGRTDMVLLVLAGRTLGHSQKSFTQVETRYVVTVDATERFDLDISGYRAIL